MPRYFTLPEAQTALQHVSELLQDAISLKSSMQEVEHELRAESERIRFSGGALVNQKRLSGTVERRESLLTQLRGAVNSIQEQGCLVKDLDQGLVDFPTLLRGEEVYLCWKLGEPGIAFWHAISDGFRGRKPIDQDFLDNHKGSAE